MKNPGWDLNIGAKAGRAAVPKNLKAAFSTISDVIGFSFTPVNVFIMGSLYRRINKYKLYRCIDVCC